MSRQSALPIISSIVRKPSCAISSRTSWAMKRKKFSTNSGCPVNFRRSSGSCVAMPTGQVFRWHTRIMMQPMTTSGAVANPYSSAPRSARNHHVSAGLHLAVDLHDDPIPQLVEHEHLLRLGQAELPRDAGVLEARERRGPVPPSWPEMSTTSACALATPAATVPTPPSATSFTAIRAARVRVLQVEDQLREVLDRVDVVVRRRRNEAHARRGVAHLRDPRIHLVARAAARLRRAWRPAPS